MKKNFFSQLLSVLLLVVATWMLSSYQPHNSDRLQTTDNDVVGTLISYYATEDFSVGEYSYTKGELICDSNDPINRIVETKGNYYKYEGDDTGAYYSWNLPKNKVRKEVYTMTQLPVSRVAKGARLKSKNGYEMLFFTGKINGKKFYGWDSSSFPWQPKYDAKATRAHKEMLVLRVQYYNKWSEQVATNELLLNTQGGNVAFYHPNRYGEGVDVDDVRYRAGLIGFLEQEWVMKDGYEGNMFSTDGRLLTDIYSVEGNIPEYWSLAYIATEDAVYYDGTLYYFEK